MRGLFAWALLAVFIILNLLDAHSTWLVVKPGNYRREKNPLARFVMRKMGLVPGIITLKGLLLIPLTYVAIDYLKDDPKSYLLVFSIANLIYTFVVSNNYRIYFRRIK